MATAAEIAAVDAFLADPKTLAGSPPEFGPTTFHKKGGYEWAATWPMQSSQGVVETGQLRFVARGYGLFSIAVILKSQGICRLDYREASRSLTNLLGGARDLCPGQWKVRSESWTSRRSF